MQKQMEIAGSEVWAVSRMVCGDFPYLVPRLNKCLERGGDYVEK
jgi:hypothetical protein